MNKSSFRKQKYNGNIYENEYAVDIHEKNGRKYTKDKSNIDREEFIKLNEHKDWTDVDTLKSTAPSDYTVTHINQTHDFLVSYFKKKKILNFK